MTKPLPLPIGLSREERRLLSGRKASTSPYRQRKEFPALVLAHAKAELARLESQVQALQDFISRKEEEHQCQPPRP